MAKETCSKVIVLLNTGNTMVIKDIAAGGAHEVDGIAYIGCLNDYQSIGVVKVLTGQVNATGALPDTYVADNASIPAIMNFGGGYYADYEIVGSDGDDPRYPGVEIANTTPAPSAAATPTTAVTTSWRPRASTWATSTTRPGTTTPLNPESGANSGAGATQDAPGTTIRKLSTPSATV